MNPPAAHGRPADTLDIGLVVRAITAISTYFAPVQIGDRTFDRAKFGTNNPAWEVYNEVCDMDNSDAAAVALLVSFGASESNECRQDITSDISEVLRASQGLAISTHTRLDSYFRFSADEYLGDIKLDQWLKESKFRQLRSTADDIRHITEKYLRKPQVVTELDRVAEILVRNRRMRSLTDKWERIFSIE